MRTVRLTTGALALAALIAPAAHAQDTAEVRRLTILSFSEPVQLPGKTLPAGKYRFEMADVNNAAHTVRVLSEDGQTVIGTFHTASSVQPQRDLRDQETLIMFAERPAGQPQAAREWYYPGRSIGEEFIYPKEQALALAKANNTSVATEEEDGKISRVEANEQAAPAAESTGTRASAESTTTPAASGSQQTAANQAQGGASAQQPAPVGTSGQTPAATPAPAPAATPAPRPAPAAAPAQGSTPAAAPARTQTPTPAQGATPARTLPRTSSQLYLFALMSMFSLAGAFGVRQLRMRTTKG